MGLTYCFPLLMVVNSLKIFLFTTNSPGFQSPSIASLTDLTFCRSISCMFIKSYVSLDILDLEIYTSYKFPLIFKNVIKLIKMKRKRETYEYNTRSKKPHIQVDYEQLDKIKEKQWVAATKTFNYIKNDHLVDWLKNFGSRERSYSTDEIDFEETFSSFLSKKGIVFEKKIVDYLRHNNFPVKHISDHYNKESAKLTVQSMKEGVPIIHSAPIYNPRNKTYGIIDLLVRSDYINRICQTDVIENTDKRARHLSGNYHYLVIDIKYHTLGLSSDGEHLLNSGNMASYKSQLCVYNSAIANVQGYNPQKAFILGRRWKYTRRGKKFQGFSCFDRLGVVDFLGYDKHVPSQTNNALSWYRKVHKYGIRWGVDPPTIPELYPNMCVESYAWNDYKKKLAWKLGEISMLWNCGVKHRMKAFSHGVTSWRDPACCSEILGIKKDSHRARVVDQIIHINRDENVPYILPTQITNNQQDWKQFDPQEIYIDFETFSDICQNFDTLPQQPAMNMIFMIGVTYFKEGFWRYKSYIIKNISYEEENRIMKQFLNFYNSLNRPNVYFWHAEKNFWKRSCTQQLSHGFTIPQTDIKWFDMCAFFKQEPITIKGCFGFGLKNIVKSMKQRGMIHTPFESECQNGMMAMIKAWNCYRHSSHPDTSHIMKDIEEYNKFDCDSLKDIMVYLRTKYA